MQGGNRGSDKASWRRSARGTTPTPPIAGREIGRRGRGRRSLLFRVSLLITLAVGLGFMLVEVFRRQPARVVPLVVTAVTRSGPQLDTDPLAVTPNPFATEDVEFLRDWFGTNRTSQNVRLFGQIEEQTGALSYQSNALINGLRNAFSQSNMLPGGPEGNTLAVFLTAHGLVHRGEPYLLMGDSVAHDPDSWVAADAVFRTILETLEQESGRLGKARVVVFLDVARSGSVWDWGKFEEDFNVGCRNVLRKLGTDRIAVIASGDLGQRSWCDPRAGNSLFVEALVQAFTGSADLNRDGRVTVGEIAEFLREQVSLKAKSIWDAAQHPTLLTEEAGDWVFIHQPQYESVQSSPPPDRDELRKQLGRTHGLWRRHNALRTSAHPPLSSDPVGWSELEKRLARLDQLLLAGRGYRDEFATNASTVDRLLSRFEAGLPVTLGELPERRLQRYFSPSGAKSSLDPKSLAAWKEKPDPESISEPLSEAQAVDLVLPWLEERGFDTESLRAAVRLLESVRREGVAGEGSRLLESHLIRLLAAPDLGHLTASSAAAVMTSLRSSREMILTKDLRASFWIRNEMDEVERDRLSAIDAVLAPGVNASAMRPLEAFARVAETHVQIREWGDAISDAYRRRDTMLHEIPRIAETLLADVEAFRLQEQSRGTSELVRRATDTAVTLAARIRLQGDSGEPSDWRELGTAVAAADTAAEGLRARLNQRIESASGLKAADESGLRQACALLVGSGVADADRRAALHERLLELLAQNPSDIGRVTGLATANAPERSPPTAELIAIDGKPPWIYWLQALDASREKPPRDVGQPAAALREAIGEFLAHPAGKQRSLADVLRSPAERTRSGQQLAAVRHPLDDLEREVRGKTIMLGNSPRDISGIAITRFAVDLQLLLYLHASRTLDEFWCEAAEGEAPYFAAAAERLIRPLIVNPDLRLDPLLDGLDLRESLAVAATASRDPTTLRPSAGASEQTGILYKLVAGRAIDFVLDGRERVPVGRAAIWSPDGPEPARLLPVGSAVDAVATSLTIPAGLPAEADTFAVHSFFRGLRRSGGLPLRQLVDPKATVFRLPEYGAPEVVVSRDDPDPIPVVIVLDCSNSMNAPRGEPPERTRLGMARTAIRQFLAGHVGKGQVSVGLVLFGHRYGWLLDEQTNRLIADGRDNEGLSRFKVFRMAQGNPQTLASRTLDSPSLENPNRDVEGVIEIRSEAIDQNAFQDFVRVLDRITAVGTTPTYQAVIKAYEMLGERESGHILVLTDGDPALVGAGSVEFGARIERIQRAFAETAKQLHEARPKVRLTFVNFDHQGEADEAVTRDLKRYFTRASIEPAVGGEALQRVLERSVRNPTAVWKRLGEPVGRRFDFGKLGVIDPWPPVGVSGEPGRPVRPAVPMELEVDTGPSDASDSPASVAVRVEGGERFDLHLGEGRLFHRRYSRLDHNVDFRLALTGGDADRYDVFALLPNLSNNRALELPLVIQNKDSREFTPRPVDVWVDVIGFNAGQPRGRRVAYSINLPEFESRQPVPVILARVRDWPTWADRVQVKGWFRFLGPPAKTVELPLDAQPSSATGNGFTLDGIEGVVFRLDRQRTADGGVRLEVTEEYLQGRPVDRLRIVTEPLPLSATISHYPEEGVVERVFEFERPMDGLRAWVSDRAWIESGAATNAGVSDILSVSDR